MYTLRQAGRLASLFVLASLQTTLDAKQAPQNPPLFRGATTLVPLDVRVVDGKGAAVTDPTQADFTILENGVPQAIRHFAAQALVPGMPPVAGKRSVTDTAAATAGAATLSA